MLLPKYVCVAVHFSVGMFIECLFCDFLKALWYSKEGMPWSQFTAPARSSILKNLPARPVFKAKTNRKQNNNRKRQQSGLYQWWVGQDMQIFSLQILNCGPCFVGSTESYRVKYSSHVRSLLLNSHNNCLQALFLCRVDQSLSFGAECRPEEVRHGRLMKSRFLL